MMNKGLELIEACALFAIDESKIDVVVHPQSIVHSMVEYVDGSVIAQMANPDMRVPITNALAWPDRIDSGVSALNLYEIARFDFEPPDHERFPALNMARQAVREGGTIPAAMNAANEVAVAAFLEGRIGFDQITSIVEEVLEKQQHDTMINLESALASDAEARRIGWQLTQSMGL